MKIDAVLLDLGNVLVLHDNALLFRNFRAAAGSKTALEDIPKEVWDDINKGRLDEEETRRAVCRCLGVDLGPERFFELWNSHFTIHQAVLPLVESLRGRVKLVLVSNTNALHIRWIRPRLPILEKFNALVLSHEVGLVKPEPEIYREALRRAGAPADRAVFFDDIADYVDAARALGLHGRVFTTADAFREALRELSLL